MRLNYYRFPEGTDPQVMFKNGATHTEGECSKGCQTCRGCEYNKGEGWRECEYFLVKEAEDTIGGIKVTTAKQLLKEFGGSAWTEHIDRDGGCFEVTAIELKGNNSKFKYNRHL